MKKKEEYRFEYGVPLWDALDSYNLSRYIRIYTLFDEWVKAGIRYTPRS